MKVIFFWREILDIFEFRHGFEFSVKPEHTAMVATPQIGSLASSLHKQVSSMGANIWKAVDFFRIISGQQ